LTPHRPGPIFQDHSQTIPRLNRTAMLITRSAYRLRSRQSAVLQGALALCILLALPGPTRAGQPAGIDSSGSTGAGQPAEDGSGEPVSALAALAGVAGRTGTTLAEGIAHGDYRGYGLRDIFPLEQVYLPEVSLPIERHPSLLFTNAGADRIRQRIRRDPYAGWAETILQQARASLMMNLADPGLPEMDRARAVKSCAFAWWITGQGAYLQKARQGLLHISDPPAVTTPEGGLFGRGWSDWIRASFIMPMYCVAYDLTAADLSSRDHRIIAGRLAAEADQLYRHLIFAPPNNHKTIMATAVGAAALTIADHDRERSQAWLDAAMAHLRSGLSQIDRDGSYREGVYYAGYISQLLFPFLFYLKQTTGIDLFTHRRVEDLTAWFLRIGQPDGSIPLFDDAWRERHQFLPLLVGHSSLGGVARWRFEGLPRRSSGRLYEAEFICAFDDRVPARPPSWERTAFFPQGGMAVLGDGWSADGLYLLLLGEDRQALASGHEQVDPGHLVLHAFGRELLADPAAGPQGRESEDRNWYLSAEAHNMLLVDGRGPVNHPFSDDCLGGRLTHCFSSSSLSGAAVQTHYSGTRIQRSVFFLGRRYYLLFDQLRSPQPHRYELVLHGLGRVRQEAPDRISWSSAETSLQVHLLGPQTEPPELSLRTGQQAPLFGTIEDHTYLRAGRSPGRQGRFTTLLLPRRSGSSELTLVEVPVTARGRSRAWEVRGQELGGARHTILTTEGDTAMVAGIACDARISVTSIDALGRREFFLAAEATFYEHLGDTCLLSDRPVTVGFITPDHRWSGYVDAGEDTVALLLETGFDPGEVRFRRFPHPYRYHAGQVTLRLEGSGLLELGAGPPLMDIPEEHRDRYPFLEQVAAQEDPAARWEELTPEQRLLARQQGLDMTADQLQPALRDLSGRMGLGSRGLEQAFVMVTGLADKAYDPDHWARLNLPERLQGHTRSGWGELFYCQKGAITDQGLRLEHLQGGMITPGGASLTAGYEAPYTGVTHGQVEYQRRGLTVTAAGERNPDRRSGRLFISRRVREAIWVVQGRADEGWDGYGLDLLHRGPALTVELSEHVPPQGGRTRRLFWTRQGQRFSPRLEWVREYEPSSGRVTAGWNCLPAAGWSWETDARFDEQDRRWRAGELTSLITAAGPVWSGEWNCEYRRDEDWTGRIAIHGRRADTRWTMRGHYRQRHRPFVTQEGLSLWRDWERALSAGAELVHRPVSPGEDIFRGQVTAVVGPPGGLRWSIRLAGDPRRQERIDWGAGIRYQGEPGWGGEWSRRWSGEGKKYTAIGLHAAVLNSRGNGLRGRMDVELGPGSEVEAYRIEIQQIGSPMSPGLLLSKEPLTGVRNDGFIRFRF